MLIFVLDKLSSNSGINEVEEYAIEYCECDEDGEFLSGSDYNLAEEV